MAVAEDVDRDTAEQVDVGPAVGVGDHVSKGEVIGYVGTTGYSTGCHLHLMVYLDGKLRNPMTWF